MQVYVFMFKSKYWDWSFIKLYYYLSIPPFSSSMVSLQMYYTESSNYFKALYQFATGMKEQLLRIFFYI